MRSLFALFCLAASYPVAGQNVYVIRGQFGGLANAYSKWTFVSDDPIRPPFAAQNVIETNYGSGIGGEFSIGYMFRPNLQLSLAYAGYEADDKSNGTTLKHSMLTANGYYYFSQSSIRPFGHIGAGVTHMNFSYLVPTSVEIRSADRWMPMLTLGTGADFFLTDETIFNVQLASHIPLASRVFRLSRGASFGSQWTGSTSQDMANYRLRENIIFLTLSGGVVFRIGF